MTTTSHSATTSLAQQYGQLWEQASEIFRQNRCHGDPYLAGRQSDDRQGISLIARLSPSAVTCVESLIGRLSAAFPEQYIVPAQDLHVTILSIEPVRSDFDPMRVAISQITRVLESSLDQQRAFGVEFKGLSASPQAVFVCGYPIDENLNESRARIKRELQAVGIGLDMDRRYMLRGAHLTILRFMKDEFCPQQLSILEQTRQEFLGRHTLATIQLVQGDWYTRASQVLWKKVLPSV